MSAHDMNKDLAPHALFFAALYLSEVWYSVWESGKGNKKCHAKARAMVLFDRAINGKVGICGASAKESKQ